MANTNIKPKITITQYRIALRVLIETFKGIKQAGIVNIFIVGTMAAILMIFGAVFRTSLSLASLVFFSVPTALLYCFHCTHHLTPTITSPFCCYHHCLSAFLYSKVDIPREGILVFLFTVVPQGIKKYLA